MPSHKSVVFRTQYPEPVKRKDLKRGYLNFVEPATCYVFMQSVGMIDDHTVSYLRHIQAREKGEKPIPAFPDEKDRIG